MTQRDLLEALGEIDPRHLKSLDLLYKGEPLWRCIMKKSVKFAVTAAAVVLTLGVIGVAMLLQSKPRADTPPAAMGSQPAGTESPLRVCVDLEKGYVSHPHSKEAAVNGFLDTVGDMGGPSDFEVEFLPPTGAEREAALLNLRTALMAGEGPDIFIVITGNDNPDFSDDDPLFPFPEKSMESGVFLGLDEYIGSAKFMEWEKLTPSVMEAGKTEKGQMLLPLCYTFPVTVFNAEDVPSLPAAMTWDEMGEDETGILAASANAGRYFAHSSGYNVMTRWALFPGCVFGRTEDYANSKMAISEDELLACMEQVYELEKREQDGEFSQLPAHYFTNMAVSFDKSARSLDGVDEGIHYGSGVTFVPCYSKDGGVTATVTAFAGINANTKRPADAFYVLDILLSMDIQSHSTLYSLYFGEYNGLPTYEGLMTEENPASGGWHMSEENYQAFSKVRDQINAARFSTLVDEKLDFLAEDCRDVCRDGEDKSKIAQLVSETYKSLQMELAES